jgi:very-short-patch-repair endonuclease/DNA-directed RNA polymerase subunit RPC12/RpoP
LKKYEIEKYIENFGYKLFDIKFYKEKYCLVSCEKDHPKYLVRLSKFKRGQRCPYCAGQKLLPENSFATHNSDKLKYWSNKNKFSPHDVSKMSDKKAWFICDDGHEWYTSVKNITLGKWCPKCANIVKLNNDEVDKTLKKQNLKRVGKYKNARSKIDVKCNICGREFDIIYDSVKNGSGCAYCKGYSKGEKTIAEYLSKINKKFIQEYTFDDLFGLGGKKLRFDFYLLEINVLLEFDGIYHYENMYDNNLEKIQKHDSLKNEYCKKNNIKLVRIPYWELENIEKIINNLYMI